MAETMHALKLGLLVLLTVVTMRCASWGVGWVLSRFAANKVVTSVGANGAGLLAFAIFLWWTLMPGEPFDYAALGFGVVIFGLCAVIDWFWVPWLRSDHPAAK